VQKHGTDSSNKYQTPGFELHNMEAVEKVDLPFRWLGAANQEHAVVLDPD
jgi:hypothetical protein